MSTTTSSSTTDDYLLLVRKRSGGRLVQFDKSKIENAIYKAMCDTEKGNKELAKSITNKISFSGLNGKSSSTTTTGIDIVNKIIDIEDIQDEVERVLMKEAPDVAKAYILYRDEKKKLRKSIASILNVDELDDNSKKNLTVNSAGVFAGRYLLRDLKTGNINETMPQLFDRIAKHIAIVDVMYSDYIFEKNSVYAHKQTTIDFNAIIEIYNTYEKEDKNERLNEIYLTHVHRRWSQIKEKIALSFEEFFFCMFTNLESKVVQNDVLALGYNIEELRDAQDVLISLFEERVSVYTKLMSSFRFLPNTPTIMNAGTKNGQLCACFLGNQPVIMEGGSLKEIKDIQIGDKVLTHTGKIKKVTQVFKRQSNKYYEIDISKQIKPSLEVTEEHPILSISKEDIKKGVRVPSWNFIRDIKKGDYVSIGYDKEIIDIDKIDLFDLFDNKEKVIDIDNKLYIKNKDGRQNTQSKPINRFVKCDKDLMSLLGYYIADGNIDKKHGIRFTFGIDDIKLAEHVINLVENIFGISSKIEYQKRNNGNGSWINIRFNSNLLRNVFEKWIGTGFNTKMIPLFISKLPKNKQIKFIDSIIICDGTNHNSIGKNLRLSNKQLIYQIYNILLRCGITPSIGKTSMPKLATTLPYGIIISGQQYQQILSYLQQQDEEYEIKINENIIHNENYLFLPIVDIKEIWKINDVYNIEVEDDHTYLCNNIVVHNCFTLDMKDDIRSIFKTISDTAIIFQGAGGVGINFSDIRPLGDLVDNIPNAATGPMSFQSIINFTTDIIKQGGKRKGANMGLLNCLSGDTLISTLKGKFPIKDLVGQEPLLYCLDNNNELRIRKADKIIHNGKRNLLRIKFDDDSILECTADHKIMLSDGTFKEAKELKQFDSIMAFYKTSYNKRYHISSTISKNWINEQILVGEYKTGQIIKQNGVNRKPDDLCIHHIDWNQLNNDPLNIEIKTISEHSKMHSKMLNEYQKINTQKRKGKTIEELYGKEKANKIKQKMSKARNDKKPWNKGLKGEQYTNHYNEFKNQFSNHKVISIEYLEGEYDVYDIIMKDYHNFVANGVFVHNCNHPQIAEFITMKLTPGVMENYNVSVGIDKDFWTAFDSKTDYNLINPRNNSVTQKIDAHQLFNLIADTAWKSAEPGVIYFDNVNKHNPLVKIKGQIKITNPCYHPDTLIETIQGQIKIKNIKEPIRVYTCNKEGKLTTSMATASWKTRENAETLKIIMNNGKSLIVTPEHKLLNFKLDWVEAKDLKVGDTLVSLCRARRGACYSGIKLSTEDSRAYQMEHRFIYKESFGEDIPYGYDIHHIDSDTYNNSLDNLELLSHEEHARHTAFNQPNNHQIVIGNKFVTHENSKHGIKTIIPMPEHLRSNHPLSRPRIISIEEGPVTDVYDISVEDTHNVIANGIVAHNCAEQTMYPNNSCTLGSINLAKYVHNKKFDYDSFREDVYETTQFLDNVIDINNYPTPEIEQESLKIRRIGLGYMGLAHALYKMKIPYNSKEGFEFIERISSLLTFHSLEASIKLAVKRGAHGYWDSIMRENSQKNLMDITFDGYTENNLSKYIVTNIEKTLREHGIRNTWTTTVAPTGTISMAADTSNGIEPVYSLVSVKNTSIGKFYYIDKEFKKALKEEGLYSDELLQKVADNHGSCKGLVPKYLEDVFVTSVDIHWIDHIMALASAQKGISNSISKTVNLPKYVTVESFKLAYLLSRYMGIKGLALYRDGSRALQVMDTTSLDNVKNNSLKNPFDKHLKNIGEKGIDKTTVIETSFSDYAMNYILSKVLPKMENPGFVLEALKNSCNLEITADEMKIINTDLKCPLCESGMIKESHCTRCSVCDYSYCM